MNDLDSGCKDCVGILLKLIFRQTVVRDAVAEHTAEFRKHLENGDLVSHQLKIVSGGKSGRTATDDCDFLSGRRSTWWRWNGSCKVGGGAL